MVHTQTMVKVATAAADESRGVQAQGEISATTRFQKKWYNCNALAFIEMVYDAEEEGQEGRGEGNRSADLDNGGWLEDDTVDTVMRWPLYGDTRRISP